MPTSEYPETTEPCSPSMMRSRVSGSSACADAGSDAASHGRKCEPASSSDTCHLHASCIRGQASALTSEALSARLEVRAVCLNWARTDRCGGRFERAFPTAILHHCEKPHNKGLSMLQMSGAK